MGIIKRGILGGFSKSVANVVGSSWKGIAYMKSKPLSVANPRTTPQVNQRSKFKGASLFFAFFLSGWVKPLWDRFSSGMSGYNAIMRQNVEDFGIDGEPATTDLVMSKGKMQPPVLSSAVADVSLGTIVFDYDIPDDVTWGQPDESLFIAVYNKTQDKPIDTAFVTVSPGDGDTFTMGSHDFIAGDVIWIWAAIKRADGTQVSNSTAIVANAVA